MEVLLCINFSHEKIVGLSFEKSGQSEAESKELKLRYQIE